MRTTVTPEEAYTMICKYNTEPFHLRHAETVSCVMREMSKMLGYGDESEYWASVGMLHDIDFERYPENHLENTPDILRSEGISEDVIHAVCAHGYGICSDAQPTHLMEKYLFAADELTGLIGAAALMRPNGIADMEVKSVVKKFKDKKFAAGCDREVIRRGAEMMGMELNELIGKTINAMRA